MKNSPDSRITDSSENEKIKKVAALLGRSESILFITGAGVSADSGLPTYRGIGGLYNENLTEEGIPIESALAGDMLSRHPEVMWKYLAQIEKRCRAASHNRGHEVIALMERHFKRVWVLTQNIDGLHHSAGSQKVIEIHGNMRRLRCDACGWHDTIADFLEIDIPPLCPRCEQVARPDVVFFGEMLPYKELQVLYEQLDQGFDMYFSVGTTSVFPYIQQPIIDARRLHKPTVEINPSPTQISHAVDVRIRLKAADALDRIWKEYLGEKEGA